MKVLAILRPPEAHDVRSDIASRAAEELSSLWRLYADGTVREMYSQGRPGAILILEAESLVSARSTLERLPLLADAIMMLELLELRPFRALEMLFSHQAEQ